MPGASCCPAPGVIRGFDIEAWLAISARNLTIAEDMNLDIATMCNGCYGTLLDANHQLKYDSDKRELINEHLDGIDRQYRGTINVKHVVEILYTDFGLESIRRRTKYGRKPKLDLNVAVHYGCHLTKPASIRPFDKEFEEPIFLDELVETTGCTSIDYKDKHMCCGAGGGVRSAFKEVSLDYTREKLENMREAGVEAIITACPFCHLQFDIGQVEINDMFKDEISAPFNIPVIYITQLLGLALGLSAKSMGLIKNEELSGVPPYTSVNPLLEKIGEEIWIVK